MQSLKDTVALITGGSSGIGLATARLFAAEGALVIVTGRRQAELSTAVSLFGDGAIGIQGDTSRNADLDRLFARIRETHGRIDVLFANAGVGEFLPLGAITEQHFDVTFAVNVKGTLFTAQKALPLMPDGSCIVLNASIASVKGIPAFSVYSATKAALRSFARGGAVDLRERRIRVNVVSPGTVPTPGYDQLGLTAEQMREFLRSQAAAVPLGRVGSPDEIAKAVLFLASGDASYVNGVELFVDGGIAQI
jgi:NAD(P)-dependent dehydrogenase (short-subunit alcohol dehydrogenase family)